MRGPTKNEFSAGTKKINFFLCDIVHRAHVSSPGATRDASSREHDEQSTASSTLPTASPSVQAACNGDGGLNSNDLPLTRSSVLSRFPLRPSPSLVPSCLLLSLCVCVCVCAVRVLLVCVALRTYNNLPLNNSDIFRQNRHQQRQRRQPLARLAGPFRH